MKLKKSSEYKEKCQETICFLDCLQGTKHTKAKAYRETLSQAAHKKVPNTGPELFPRHERSTDLKNFRD